MKELATKIQQPPMEQGDSDVIIQSAILEAVKNADIDPARLEKFLDLQIKLEERQATRELNAALASFQSKCPVIKRTKKGHNAKMYAPLEDLVLQIQSLLFETGLSYSFDVHPTDDKTNCMKTIIRHRTGGHFVSLYFFPRSDVSGNKNEAQGIRSANSYAKRTGLENALGIVTSDDDKDGGAPGSPVTPEQINDIKALVKETGSDAAKLLSFLGAESFEVMTAAQAKKAVHSLKQKKAAK